MRLLVAAGLASEQEVDDARAALERFWNAPDASIMQVLFIRNDNRV